MTGGEASFVGGLGAGVGMFVREAVRAVFSKMRSGNGNGKSKEDALRTLLREESRQVFEDALGQHVVPALAAQNEKLESLVDIRDGIKELVVLSKVNGSRRRRR